MADKQKVAAPPVDAVGADVVDAGTSFPFVSSTFTVGKTGGLAGVLMSTLLSICANFLQHKYANLLANNSDWTNSSRYWSASGSNSFNIPSSDGLNRILSNNSKIH
ncbi:Protein of unknown function [Cotesia congregata]|uniref:Uncharacterized protein n=1 Tax=Cotesia congregata TaxID=51543 RepID=A0A8J2HFF3_COTCN|nr:Protein of unknown function [Cotesia congregata]